VGSGCLHRESYLEILENKMFANSKQLTAMHMVALASKRLCAGEGYWALVGFTPSNEQINPDRMASFYKESGN